MTWRKQWWNIKFWNMFSRDFWKWNILETDEFDLSASFRSVWKIPASREREYKEGNDVSSKLIKFSVKLVQLKNFIILNPATDNL